MVVNLLYVSNLQRQVVVLEVALVIIIGHECFVFVVPDEQLKLLLQLLLCLRIVSIIIRGHSVKNYAKVIDGQGQIAV